jgi:ParB/RepB/Spo0J family partition protein
MPETLEINLDSLVIDEDRQRKDLGNIAELAQSIAANQQLQPIIVKKLPAGQYALVAGERRVRAFQMLGRKIIEARVYNTLSKKEQHIIELEENVKRKQLEWPEYCQAVAEYMRIAKAPLATAALELGLSESSISILVAVAEAVKNEPVLLEQRGYTAVYNIIKARAARAMDNLTESLMSSPTASPFADMGLEEEEVAQEVPAEEEEEKVAAEEEEEEGRVSKVVGAEIKRVEQNTIPKFTLPPPLPTHLKHSEKFSALTADFRSWAKTYTGPRFNLIHCDFPYGLNMDSANLQNSASKWVATNDGRYDDSPELYSELLNTFFEHQARFIADSAHCIFWCATKNFAATALRFRAAGWDVYDSGLIWHKSDNAGIASNVKKFPRHTYEIAVFAVRGGRVLAKLKADSYSGPTTKEHHLSEKPLEMLDHFLSLVVDTTTTILDPTCGGGTALQVAVAKGASYALGLDVDQSHVLKTYQRLKAAVEARESLTRTTTGE